MKKAIFALAVVVAGVSYAPAAGAIRRCEPLEIDCHRTCTLPQTDQGIKNIYFNQC